MDFAANPVFTAIRLTQNVIKNLSVSVGNAQIFQIGKPDLLGENRDFALSGYRNRNKEKEIGNKNLL